MDKMQLVRQTLDETHDLLKAKNADYGDSVGRGLDKAISKGVSPYTILWVRLADKFNRFEELALTGEQQVKDESIDDTLTDLIGYITLFKAWQRGQQHGTTNQTKSGL